MATTAERQAEAAARVETRDYEALAARVRAAASTTPLSWRVYGQQASSDGSERYDLYIVRVPAQPARDRPAQPARDRPAQPSHATGHGPAEDGPAQRPARFRVLLNGGTHGDEPAGPEAVVRFLEERIYQHWPEVAFTAMPCTNPWGYVHNRREGPGGKDLNRSFRRAGPLTREVSLVKRALGRQRFDLFLDCHEDVDTPGLYVFAPATLGHTIVEAVKGFGPLHPGPLVDGEIPLNESVVEIDRRLREQRRPWTTWPLPFYVSRYHQRAPRSMAGNTEVENVDEPDVPVARMATVETPVFLPLEQRARMHLAAIEAALRWLHHQ